MLRYRHVLLVASSALLAGSCMDAGPELDLSHGQMDRDVEEMRRRMNVRIYREGVSGLEEAEMSAELLARGDAYPDCRINAAASQISNCGDAPDTCEQPVCAAIIENCVSQRMLHLITIQAPEPANIQQGSEGPPWLIGPQHPAAQIALAREAYAAAVSSFVRGTDALQQIGAGAECLDDLASNGTQLQEVTAAMMLESLTLADEALAASQRAITAVADAQFSDEASIADAARLAIALPIGSRSALAHLNAGGPEGLEALPRIAGEGFCPEPRLSPQARQALGLIRTSGVPPRAILDPEISLEYLLTGVSVEPEPDFDGVFIRIAHLTSAPHLLEATLPELYDGWGLSSDAFAEAREHLANEFRAFGRSIDATLPPEQIGSEPGDTTATLFNIYASTRTPPEAPLPSYWSAIARFDPVMTLEAAGYPGAPVPDLDDIRPDVVTAPNPLTGFPEGSTIAPPAFSDFVDGAATIINDLASNLGGSTPEERVTRGVFRTFGGGVSERRVGRMRLCWLDSDGVNLRIHVLTNAALDPTNVAVVVGHDGLNCAVRGHVEGSECDLIDYIVPGAWTTEFPPHPPTGLANEFQLQIGRDYLAMQTDLANPLYTDPDASPSRETLQLYVVERSGTRWQEVAGAMVVAPTSAGGEYLCQDFPFVPEADRAAADALAPSTSYCAFSSATCAGIPLDQRIPLENELTSDGDAVESSWRHYLTLARQAAEHADRLGEDLIRAGLEMDLRAEAAIDELENLCGVSIDISGLTSPTGAATGAPCVNDGECDADERCQAGACVTHTCVDTEDCDPGFRCDATVCVLDPVSMAMLRTNSQNAQRLAECLGSDATTEWVSLGDEALCFWWDGSNPSSICTRDNGVACSDMAPCAEGYECIGGHCLVDADCPSAGAEGATSCPSPLPSMVNLPPGMAMIAAPTVPLSFFIRDPETPTSDGLGAPTTPPCDDLAALRSNEADTWSLVERHERVNRIRNHEFFTLSNLQLQASRISWAPLPGDYSEIRLDDALWFSTGDPYSMGTRSWPCGPGAEFANWCPSGMMSESDPGDGESHPLFCRSIPANDCPPGSEADPYGFVGDPPVSRRERRARMNDMLARAVIAARVITGTPLAGIRFPFVPRTRTDQVCAVGSDYEGATTPGCEAVFPTLASRLRVHDGTNDTSIWSGAANALSFDEVDDGPGPRRVQLFDMSRGNLFRIDNDVSASAEWTVCPYDYPAAGCVEVIDDDVDDDDDDSTWCSNYNQAECERETTDRNIGLIVRAFDSSGTNGVDSTASSRILGQNGLVHRIMLEPEREFFTRPGTELSAYWRRSFCGDHNQVVCDTTDPSVSSSSSVCFSNFENGIQPSECYTRVGCHQNYWNCQDAAEGRGFVFDETFDGNRAFIAPQGLSVNDVLNGLELMCAAQRDSAPGGLGAACGNPPPIETVGDLFEAEAFIRCNASDLKSQASRVVFNGVPTRTVEALRQGGVAGVYGSAAGEYAAASDELRAALLEYAQVNQSIALTVDSIGIDIGMVRSEVQSLNLQSEIGDWQLVSNILEQTTRCVAATASAAGIDSVTGGDIAAATATCVNAVAQAAIAVRVNELEDEVLQQAVVQAFARFELSLRGHLSTLESSYIELRQSTAAIEAAVTRLKNVQRQGRRTLARALMLDSDEDDPTEAGALGRQFHVNTVLRRRQNTLRIRYEEAHRNAVRLAYLAKIALEQRLGMGLDEMTDPLTLVDEAPASWHTDVCSMTGINYERIRQSTTSETGEPGIGEGPGMPEDYAGEYVGDYVRRLEMTFESYSLDYPFQDGTDTAVMSLRDEILGLRASCSAEVPNLLYEAGNLDAHTAPGSGLHGWVVENCNDFPTWPPTPLDPPQVPPPMPSCIHAELLGGTAPGGVPEFGAIPGYLVHFGTEYPPTYPDGTTIVETAPGVPAARQTVDSRLVQWVSLPPGRYRLSYYAQYLGGVHDVPPTEMVRVVRLVSESVDPDGEEPVALAAGAAASNGFYPAPPEPLMPTAGRYHTFFDIAEASTVGIVIRSDLTTTPVDYRTALIAGLMLEDVTGEVLGAIDDDVAARFAPRPFFGTTQVRDRFLTVCEDTDGSEMRRRAFTRRCEGLCPDGYGDCPGALQQHCYYETAISLDPDRLQQAGLLGGSGFAFGNFNYRIEDIGVNVVGTGVRDCSESSTPSTCYSSGNVSFSVVHNGPYPVRNHRGALRDAPLFVGRVERARALAAERYVTNPLSSADRGLVEPYLRHELRGRPMGGTVLLRIWDDPGLVWERVEDLQIVLNYRYWTRQR